MTWSRIGQKPELWFFKSQLACCKCHTGHVFARVNIFVYVLLLVFVVQAIGYSRFGKFLGKVSQLDEPSVFSPVWFSVSVVMFYVVRILSFCNFIAYK